MHSIFFLLILFLFHTGSLKAQYSLSEAWRTPETLPVPESVLYDEEKDLLYVSCIDGTSDAKDGKGAIALVSVDGKVTNPAFIQGLNAPKGMAKVKNLLYVADITDIVVIDLTKKKVVNRIPVDSARFLNDVTADAEGCIYVSDSKTGKVHRLKGKKPEIYLQGLDRPNGLLHTAGYLYVLANGRLIQYGSDLQPRTMAERMDPSTDGLVSPTAGEFIVSSWAGAIYYVKDRNAELILDTRPEKSNTADIGYNPKTKTVFVPTFLKNSVVAYKLN